MSRKDLEFKIWKPVAITPSIDRKLEKIAAKRGISTNKLISQLIEQALKSKKYK